MTKVRTTCRLDTAPHMLEGSKPMCNLRSDVVKPCTVEAEVERPKVSSLLETPKSSREVKSARSVTISPVVQAC